MKKRTILLLVFAIVLATAPAALADHCVRCSSGRCAIAFTGGYLSCDDSGGTCRVTGSCGGPHPLIEEEWLSTEFTVASVERLDEPQQPSASATRVASLDTKPAEKR